MDKAAPPSATEPTGRILPLLFVSTLLGAFGTSAANVLLPVLAERYSASFLQIQTVVIAYLLGLTLAALGAGRYGDRFGLRRVHLAGLALFAGASLLCAVAPNLVVLSMARLLQGAGAACVMTLALALVRQYLPPDTLGRALGLLASASALGTAGGPVISGLLEPLGGWRTVFWLQLAGALGTLVLARKELPRPDVSAASSPATSVAGALQWLLLPSLIFNLVVAMTMMATLVVAPFYLSLGLGASTAMTGVVMAVGPCLSILCGIPAGRSVDRWGSIRVRLLGLIMLTLGAALLALLPPWLGITGYILGIVILTPGYQLFQAANNAYLLEQAVPERRGTLAGLLNLSRNLGLLVGACCVSALFTLNAGADSLSRLTTQSLTAGLQGVFASIAILLAAMLALAVWPVAMDLSHKHDGH
ncbi:hypothetical protein NS274_19980 [Pseudomonas oryzihabitans]|nr:hypothetical protein NS274_19980 [Pseudomonas psychrotolerans]KTT39519.1 hypothetical protein SB5_11415 [Pseudomonas psychrotolerans]KTT42769.1 hypothetical protein RSA46_20075 [Pseudomonas psychrotolerans]KTT63356.1 hypothetical protein NS383_20160 [Pseudomonas psychrotolerans]